ncbi:uncharacterized protein B4U79_14018 [Dinothrombium tinctorium]|uniref:Shavenoid isoform B-like N-terminal domain-containing protein n=1 Tax=Dinothrombium tinctorium TaxID=1965070 RepID=A0A3S3SJX8_9ACAR|nr:uncharacterized protein B4U79_01923 [Dinothrombium tinctorium]RWS10309.1 uncharacterized protein B4U79_07681 [Dinothrombium tinctorium]RWS16164.1 uncharacterized protein B4U79_14018 [Dinothrombium tinctorium]
MANRVILCFSILNFSLSVQMQQILEITRDYHGDMFIVSSQKCSEEACHNQTLFSNLVPGLGCKCQCFATHQVFREDSKQCVHQLTECPLAEFVRPTSIEQIPVVSLPKAGQLVHPGAHLTILGMINVDENNRVMCSVSRVDVMTYKGWHRLDDKFSVFELYEDKNKTFLQWLGNDDIRHQLQQRLILVQLNCSFVTRSSKQIEKTIFQPCAALRIGWVPGAPLNTYLLSSGNPSLPQVTLSKSDNSANQNFFIIGLSLGILGLMYVFSVMVYLKTKKDQFRKRNDYSLKSTPQTQSLSIESPDISDIITTRDKERIDESKERKSEQRRYGLTHVEVNEVKKYDQTQNGNLISDVDSCEDRNSQNFSLSAKNMKKDQEVNEFGSSPEMSLRRGLQINLELLDPDHLASPPPPALEFLQRIREMIAAAKNRIKNFRFKPTLRDIPEDDYFYQDTNQKKDKTKNAGYESLTSTPVPPPRQLRPKRNSGTPIPERRETNHCSLNVLPNNQRLSEILQKYEEEASECERVDEKVCWESNDCDAEDKKSEEKSSSENNGQQTPDISDRISRKEIAARVCEKLNEEETIELTDTCSKVSSDDSEQDKGIETMDETQSCSETPDSMKLNVNEEESKESSKKEARAETTSDNNGDISDEATKNYLFEKISPINRKIVASKARNLLKSNRSIVQNKIEPTESYNSLESLSASSCEMSTTSSTYYRSVCHCSSESQSINSDITEDSLETEVAEKCVCQRDYHNPLEECLRNLENALIENDERSQFKIDRATKGLEPLERIKASKWNHICHEQKSKHSHINCASHLTSDFIAPCPSVYYSEFRNRCKSANELLSPEIIFGCKNKAAKRLNRNLKKNVKYKAIDDSAVLQKLSSNYKISPCLSDDDIRRYSPIDVSDFNENRQPSKINNRSKEFNRNCKQFISRKQCSSEDEKAAKTGANRLYARENSTKAKHKSCSKVRKPTVVQIASDSDFVTRIPV